VLATDLSDGDWNAETARRALRNEAPFAPLHVRHLHLDLGDEDAAGVIAFSAAVASHASLTALTLEFAPLETPATLDAVVDAALARRLQSMSFCDCGLHPASVPALARLLSCGALTELACIEAALLDAPAARVLGAALRANSTLTLLTLNNAGVFDDPDAEAELLGALTGHASVQTLRLQSLRTDGPQTLSPHRADVGAALGALVAANAPALTELDVSYFALGDQGLRPLFEALPANTHLRELDCDDNGLSEALARDVLLPAVRANAGLRALHASASASVRPSLYEAERIVSSRAAA
jgi:hypothetical protein